MPKLEERPEAGWLKRSIETGTAFVESHLDWAEAMEANWLTAESHSDFDQPKVGAEDEDEGSLLP